MRPLGRSVDHRDPSFQSCAWCGEKTVNLVTVDPGVVKKVKGEQVVIEAPHRVPCCSHCDERLARTRGIEEARKTRAAQSKQWKNRQEKML